MQASEYAQDTQRDPWDYAVEIRYLLRGGLTVSDLRWLLHKGFVDARDEISSPKDGRRVFRPLESARFRRHCCFILTPAGVEFAQLLHGKFNPSDFTRLLSESQTNDSGARANPQPSLAAWPVNGTSCSASASENARPRWDSDYREVRYLNRVVKQFKLPSPNQEAILLAFEEEGWPPRVDDPLTPSANCDPKQRLHDTIRSLNRNQKNRLLRFKGDGTGQGILWEPISPESPDEPE